MGDRIDDVGCAAVTGDVIPSTGTRTYSITGEARGCTVDAGGEVPIGSTAGSIAVRVSGSTRNYDEVTITITEYKAPVPETPAPKGGVGDEGAIPAADAGSPAASDVPAPAC